MLCELGGIQDMGLAVLDAQEAKEKAESEVRFLSDQLWLLRFSHDSELRAYHRQWWLMVPLGVLTGVALTITVQLLLAR